MVSTFTPNLQLEEPARGDYVGTWDSPVNNNATMLDLVGGGISTINLGGGSVVLSAAQFQCKTLIFNSTLVASVTVTFPSTFKKTWEVYHTCTGSSNFTITLQTTIAGGQAVCCPPGETVDVFSDGTNLRFKNLARVGTYWDYAGSSVPNWVSGCTVPPYLNCDGTAFSSATYPQLATVLAGTTLPDMRGRVRMATDQGAGRVSSAVAGFNPNAVAAGGGVQSQTIANSNLPAHSHPITDQGHTHPNGASFGTQLGFQGGGTYTPVSYTHLTLPTILLV